mgnify:FL=1
MKRKNKILSIIGISLIIYIISYFVLISVSIRKENITEICTIIFLLSVCISTYFVERTAKKMEKEVLKSSAKIKNIEKINKDFIFKIIKNKTHRIIQREYSRKSLDRVKGNDIILYNIENNVNDLRTDIENSIYNISLLGEYEKKVANVLTQEETNKTKYSDKKYQKIEKIILNNKIYKKNDFIINIYLKVFYISNGGNVYDKREGTRTYDELIELYQRWKKSSGFEITKQQERQIMNNDIRYNVLKRDNFTCQKCGATVLDGIKLEVDHIIPVSKGGKTNMSNLQTLCNRCNKGKSNKTEDDFKHNVFCPKCGEKLIKRKGKYGPFLGCSNYPKCKYIQK